MAGKGDKMRPTNLKNYNENYDSIDWGIIWCEKCKAHHKAKLKCSQKNSVDDKSKNSIIV